ncbi:zinc phosphodiesterase ELAC protein 1-like [Corticium candelabrum]|uniref:zinc phosphodiesterase ELAC protein 1-like n=1 Tax=Corticium candelabrum TaxID=121492 RepID=UPI002E26C748|nr:zinc phosphodiesterase ELAC protein 1-like [Corticium candelabrum]
MELTFLGTGSCYPTPTRGVSCIALKHEAQCWLFDCGEGSQIQLMKSNVKPGRIRKIFITHLHGDHLFGLPGLLCTISQNSSADREPVELYGPVGLRRFIRVALELSRSLLGFNYIVHELVPLDDAIAVAERLPESDKLWQPRHDAEGLCHPNEIPGGRMISCDSSNIWHIGNFGALSIAAAPLSHRVPCFGYCISESEIPGKLNVELLRSKGILPGPLYGKLKNGEAIVAPNGEIVTTEEALGPPTPGRKIVILGDTSESIRITSIAQNCDVLVHEATNEDELQETTIKNGHSTPTMAGQFATKVNAATLILTHVSQRYKTNSSTLGDGEVPVAKLAKQASACFTGKVIVAEDLFCFSIPLKRR